MLGEAADACFGEKVLSKKALDLTSVVREYRNLIHPGRVIRLGEKVDRNSSVVAKALVDMVVDEVVAARKQVYGFTAEQLLNKVESDSSAIAVLSHYLKRTNECERLRLLVDLVPNRFIELQGEEFSGSNELPQLFRKVFDTLSKEDKEIVSGRFVQLLKEGTGKAIRLYESAFFEARDLEFVEESDRELVKDHILHRLRTEYSEESVKIASGIVGFLKEAELFRVVSQHVRGISSRNARNREAGKSGILDLWFTSSAGQTEFIEKQLKESEKDLEERNPAAAQELRELLEVPF